MHEHVCMGFELMFLRDCNIRGLFTGFWSRTVLVWAAASKCILHARISETGLSSSCKLAFYDSTEPPSSMIMFVTMSNVHRAHFESTLVEHSARAAARMKGRVGTLGNHLQKNRRATLLE